MGLLHTYHLECSHIGSWAEDFLLVPLCPMLPCSVLWEADLWIQVELSQYRWEGRKRVSWKYLFSVLSPLEIDSGYDISVKWTSLYSFPLWLLQCVLSLASSGLRGGTYHLCFP